MRVIRLLFIGVFVLSLSCDIADPIMVNEISASRFLGLMRLDMKITNTSKRDIKAVKGIITCNDIFGAVVFENEVEVSEPIPSGAEISWRHSIDCNLEDRWGIWKKFKKSGDFSYKWKTVKVVYDDATLN